MRSVDPRLRRDPRRPTLRFALAVALIVVCFLGGGSARDDVVSLLYLRPVVIAIGAALLIVAWPSREGWRDVRVPLALLAALAAIMVVQLVPLPPGWAAALPGHARLADAARIAGIAEPWRPISVSPDLTLNSLVALTIPVAMLVAFAALDPRERARLLPVLIVVAGVDALFGLAQIAGGNGSAFYLYRVTNPDMAVGLFANRNHSAALLVLALPMLATFATGATLPRASVNAIRVAAAAMGGLVLVTLLVIGSRGGLIFGLVALAMAGWQVVAAGILKVRPRTMLIGAVAAFVGIVALAFALAAVRGGEAGSLARLTQSDPQAEARVGNLPILIDLATRFLPFGSGFGTFDPAFRMIEPTPRITPYYLNHAHNDLAELVITAGVAGAIVLLAALAWTAAGGVRAFRAERGRDGAARARLGAFVLAVLFAWSLFDYPLRTPALALVCAIAAGWLSVGDGVLYGDRRERYRSAPRRDADARSGAMGSGSLT